jgi:hypothetical protein
MGRGCVWDNYESRGDRWIARLLVSWCLTCGYKIALHICCLQVGRFHIFYRPRRPVGRVAVYLYSFLDLDTRRRWGVRVTRRPLSTSRERSGTHCTGGWVGPMVCLGRCGKSRPPSGFDPWTVQPVASRCTAWATLPTHLKGRLKNGDEMSFWNVGTCLLNCITFIKC